MRAGLLPKLLISPSAFLVLVCVYGYIMFTVYLSFTTSTMLPNYDLAGGASYERLMGLENWRVSLINLGIFAVLYIVIAGALGLAFDELLDEVCREILALSGAESGCLFFCGEEGVPEPLRPAGVSGGHPDIANAYVHGPALDQLLDRLRAEDATILLVDQMAGLALTLADRAYVMESGRIVASGAASEIAADGALERAYLGAT